MDRAQYSRLLNTEYWKGYSYAIIKERNFTCGDCGRQFYNQRQKLQVHHLVYRDKCPWSYNPEELIVLCEDCHKKRHGIFTDNIESEQFEPRYVYRSSGANTAKHALVIFFIFVAIVVFIGGFAFFLENKTKQKIEQRDQLIQQYEQRLKEESSQEKKTRKVKKKDVRRVKIEQTEQTSSSENNLLGTDVTPEVSEEVEFSYVEQMPVFPGGEAALNKFIHDHLKYPAVSREEGVQGVVMLRFVVNENGSVGEVEILKGLDSYCDREAKRIVQSLPRFTPGRKEGKPVKMWFQFPIRFEIQ